MQPFDMGEELEQLYLEWFNNYLTIEKFAEHYCLSDKDALNLVTMGKRIHLKRKSDELEKKRFTVWVGGVEALTYYVDLESAREVAQTLKDAGYDDVSIEEVEVA